MKRITAVLMVFVLLFSAGCGNAKKEEANVLYYINNKGNGLDSKKIELSKDADEACLQMIEKMSDESTLPQGCKNVIPDTLSIASHSIRSNICNIDLAGDYGSLSKDRQLLLRAGLTKNFEQINGIDYVKITIQQEELLDSNGDEIGLLCADDFVIPDGNELNTYSNMEMELFFLDTKGNIVSEKRNVYYNSSVPVEQVVLEELIKGPYQEGHVAAIPYSVEFNNVMIREGIGYVDFMESVLNSTEGYDIAKMLATIVKSFEAVCDIGTVQFSVNGDTQAVINGVDIDQAFEANA